MLPHSVQRTSTIIAIIQRIHFSTVLICLVPCTCCRECLVSRIALHCASRATWRLPRKSHRPCSDQHSVFSTISSFASPFLNAQNAAFRRRSMFWNAASWTVGSSMRRQARAQFGTRHALPFYASYLSRLHPLTTIATLDYSDEENISALM
jgi:hypothetical protein